MSTYDQFLAGKSQLSGSYGFKPLWMPDFLFDFQSCLVDWSIHKGRGACWADCGLGKTPMQLVWAQNVVQHTNRPVLILTPLAVSAQTIREAEKFSIPAVRSSGGTHDKAEIVVTNYEKLHHFSSADYAGVVCDESGILKSFDGVRRDAIVEFMRTRPYRLLCTATAAPNDYVELGNSSESLGEMGFQDMVSRFFKKEDAASFLGWGRASYRLRSHASRDFWRWICSWARAVRKPSDLGFEDGPFQLPELRIQEHIVSAEQPAEGRFFDVQAVGMVEQRAERRRTLLERCERVAELVKDTGRSAVCWCHLNTEGDLLEKIIPDAIQVSGQDSDDEKEERFIAFAKGQARVLVTKPILGGFGLNWQHCSHQTFFPSHSFEQWYQAVRRSWRFGQKNSVVVDVITSEGERGVRANLQRKADQADAMFANLVELMHDQLTITSNKSFPEKEVLPSWL